MKNEGSEGVRFISAMSCLIGLTGLEILKAPVKREKYRVVGYMLYRN